MFAHRIGVTSLTAACLVVCAACGRPATTPQPPPVELAKTDTALVAEHELQSGTSIAGTLQPSEQASIAAQLGGYVRDVRVEIGDHVSRGELLARLEVGGLRDAAQSAGTAVDAAERALALARSQAERTRKLVGEGAAARQKLEVDQNAVSAAASQLQQAQAQLASSRQTLSETTIRSPIDGSVSRRSVDDGDVVTPGSPLFTIIDPSSLRLSASVAASELGRLKVGSPVTFRVHGQPDTLRGEVTRIAPAADPTTGQIALLVSIPNTSDRVLAGLFAEGRVYTRRQQALAVPLSAIDFTRDEPTATALRGGRAQHVPLELGMTDEMQDLVEVRSGLKAGERVVLGPERSIAEGRRVQLKAAPAEAETPPGAAQAYAAPTQAER